MAAGRVSVPSRLIVLLVTVLGLYCRTFSAKDDDHHRCEPSSCGEIQNISYPFRLKHDPENCGDKRYELSCENNITVLYLYSGKYYVQAINYNNYTIRVVDANVDKGNCSSIPRDSLTGYNYHRQDPYSFEVRQLDKHEIARSFSFQNSDQIELSKPIIFITCKTPVNSPLYVETAPCIDAISSPSSALLHSQGHSFVMVGHVNASDLTELCRVELMVRTSWPGTKGTNLSYIDIHNELVYGFELSWLQSYDRGRKGSVNNDTNKVFCAYDCSYGWSQPNHCGMDIKENLSHC